MILIICFHLPGISLLLVILFSVICAQLSLAATEKNLTTTIVTILAESETDLRGKQELFILLVWEALIQNMLPRKRPVIVKKKEVDRKTPNKDR